mmetsp:Transcript_6710/g.19540  ORF Transcript_6710/g.19540 Transcript_6710/m.19540 type:complete len:231 (-) Transcript_6710:2013-2705(-)
MLLDRRGGVLAVAHWTGRRGRRTIGVVCLVDGLRVYVGADDSGAEEVVVLWVDVLHALLLELLLLLDELLPLQPPGLLLLGPLVTLRVFVGVSFALPPRNEVLERPLLMCPQLEPPVRHAHGVVVLHVLVLGLGHDAQDKRQRRLHLGPVGPADAPSALHLCPNLVRVVVGQLSPQAIHVGRLARRIAIHSPVTIHKFLMAVDLLQVLCEGLDELRAQLVQIPQHARVEM